MNLGYTHFLLFLDIYITTSTEHLGDSYHGLLHQPCRVTLIAQSNLLTNSPHFIQSDEIHALRLITNNLCVNCYWYRYSMGAKA